MFESISLAEDCTVSLGGCCRRLVGTRTPLITIRTADSLSVSETEIFASGCVAYGTSAINNRRIAVETIEEVLTVGDSSVRSL